MEQERQRDARRLLHVRQWRGEVWTVGFVIFSVVPGLLHVARVRERAASGESGSAGRWGRGEY